MDMEQNKENKSVASLSSASPASNIETAIDDILQDLPEDKKRELKTLISITSLSLNASSRNNPISSKVTPQHIADIIKYSDEQDKRDRDDKKGERLYNLLYIIVGVLFVVFLVLFLKDAQQELLKYILTSVLSFIGGMGFRGLWKKKDEA